MVTSRSTRPDTTSLPPPHQGTESRARSVPPVDEDVRRPRHEHRAGAADHDAPLARARAVAKHPRLMPYRRLMLLVIIVNVAVLLHHLRRGDWQLADGTA